MTYEQKIEKLEAIVAQLEGGNVPLSEMVALYEQGQSLAAQCQKELDNAAERMQLTEEPEL
ncbi:MAG: exodeoxyribonuclease VII small subunit [Clostridiales bacterium]|nr:exodeoxyribonuclease VII small subunit [Clostridiales bacterium]